MNGTVIRLLSNTMVKRRGLHDSSLALFPTWKPVFVHLLGQPVWHDIYCNERGGEGRRQVASHGISVYRERFIETFI